MRIGFVELVLLLFIASITVGPNVALFVDRWLRRAQRTSAAAARRKAQLEAQAAIEREALMTRFRVASNIFALLMLAALAYGLLLRPIDTPPESLHRPGCAAGHRCCSDGPLRRQPRTAGSWAAIWAWTASVPRTALSTLLPTTVQP